MKYHLKKREHQATSQQSPKRINGQGLTEYIIIVALIAIAAIGAVSFFGDGVKATFLALGSELVGGEEIDTVATTQTSFDKAKADAEGLTTLQNYRN